MNDNLINSLEYTVSELSTSIKRIIEDNFDYIRLKAEVGRVSKPKSGHIYLDLKDDTSVISGIIWKGSVNKLNILPEEGLEVVCTGKVTTYACLGMVDRGELFLDVGNEVYTGMILGERNRPEDLNVNITKEKKLTNMRASGSDNTVNLRPPKKLSLDQSIEFIAEDELVEITPESIRLRKMELDQNKRLAARKKEKYAG